MVNRNEDRRNEMNETSERMLNNLQNRKDSENVKVKKDGETNTIEIRGRWTLNIDTQKQKTECTLMES